MIGVGWSGLARGDVRGWRSGQLPGLLQVNVLLAPGLQIHGEAGLELLIGDKRVFALFYLE